MVKKKSALKKIPGNIRFSVLLANLGEKASEFLESLMKNNYKSYSKY